MLAVGNLKECSRCGEVKTLDGYNVQNSRKDKLDPTCKSCKSINNAGRRDYRIRKKLIVFNHYTNNTLTCKLCGFSNFDALTLDHINADGVQHRIKTGGGGIQTYNCIIRNNFPDNYQVICQNCNCQNCNWLKYIKEDRPGRNDIDIQQKLFRIKVFRHYCNGPIECIDCGYTEQLALTVDHIYGNGKKHAKARGVVNVYRWLINNNFPEGYQILCYNCNVIKYKTEELRPVH